jgi:NADPH-dependent 2,4-dienoyl-CoA reductase/sulfur reductase-like enzyme
MGVVERIVVVGAGLAGLRAAEALRGEGFAGKLTIVGDEPHRPYNRQPLSKQLLAGTQTPGDCELRAVDGLDVTWALGRRAAQLDLAERAVELADGDRLPFDGAVLATGARARRWPDPVPAGVLTLRGLDDALALQAALGARPRRVLVVGAGFVGAEVAATCANLGVPVTLLELEAAPLARLLGPEVGAFLAATHRAHGIDLRTQTTVARFLGTDRLHGAELTDGTRLEADVAVVALGADPNTDWLHDSGLVLDRGVRCDAALRAVGAERVVAAGDLARWPHPLFDGELVTVGHWTNAVEQAAAAGRALLTNAPAPPFAAVPTFWSDQHGVKLRSVGLPALADETYRAEGDPDTGRFLVVYGRRGTLVGALAVNLHRRLPVYRQLIAERASVGDALQVAAEHARQRAIGLARSCGEAASAAVARP